MVVQEPSEMPNRIHILVYHCSLDYGELRKLGATKEDDYWIARLLEHDFVGTGEAPIEALMVLLEVGKERLDYILETGTSLPDPSEPKYWDWLEVANNLDLQDWDPTKTPHILRRILEFQKPTPQPTSPYWWRLSGEREKIMHPAFLAKLQSKNALRAG